LTKKGKTTRVIFALVVTLLITIPLNWDYFTDLVHPETPKEIFYLPLEDTEFFEVDEEDLTEFIEYRRYVPNYDTEIYIQFAKSKVELGDYIQFRVSIVDNGIVSLEKPYFYAFLVTPSKQAVVSFPDTIYRVDRYSKMNAWSTQNHYENFYRDCLHYKTLYIPRSTLTEGNGKYVYTYDGHLYWSEHSEVGFRYYINEDSKMLGDWKVYVFTYDEEYHDRLGDELETEEKDNFIQYSVAGFQVTPKTPPDTVDYAETFNRYILSPIVFLITFVLNYVGIYPLLEKRRDKLSGIGRTLREHWAFVLSIIVIIIIQIAFLYL